MIVKKIHIVNLRNHSDTKMECSDSSNIIFGLNGSGKTTILEAIAIGAHSKSFQPTEDKNLIKYNQESYFVDINAQYDLLAPYKVSVLYKKGQRKQINSSLGQNLLPKELIGEMPIVILTPDFKSITFGSPQDRRQFLDTVLSQSSKTYLDAILKQKKYLKHRNAILAQYSKEGKLDKNLLASVTDFFIKFSAEVIFKRNRFLNEFADYFRQSYQLLSESSEYIKIFYKPDSLNYHDDLLNSQLLIEEELKNTATQVYNNELKRGTSLFGPQKDDIDIFVNDGLAKEVASQGQHKSLLIALKFAEFEFLKSKSRELPIILLDDIFSELDSKRASHVLSILADKKAQTFITITEADRFLNFNSTSNVFNFVKISNGKLA